MSATKHSPEVQAAFDKMRQEREEYQASLPAIRAEGLEALKRLLEIGLGHSGQCKIVANFLLSLYNGMRFKFDLTDFRSLDVAIFNDCIAVLKMDKTPVQEVHCYFKDGGRIWEQMAKDWGITDYMALKRKLEQLSSNQHE